MRGRVARFTTLALVVLAAACGHAWSIHPLFGKRDLIREPALLGVWRDAAKPSGERWVLMRTSDTASSYVLALADSAIAVALSRTDLKGLFSDDTATKARLRRDASARTRRARDSALVFRLRTDARGPRWFDVRLGRLGGSLFADISPSQVTDSEPRLGKSLFVPAHWFWKVSVEGTRLRITPLNEAWLDKLIDSGVVRIAHDTANGDVILTAPTPELQRLVTRYAKDTTWFPAKREVVYQRVQ